MVRLEDFKVGEIKKMISKYNKEVKITTSGLKKADLIKKIREHPRLTVTESDKGVNIKVKSDTTMGGKKIKVKKDEKPAEKPEEKPAAEGTKPEEKPVEKPKAQLGQSGIGKKRKREPPKPKKKKVIDVYVKPNEKEEKPKPKPKVPTITVTEEEKPKKKVIKRGGRFITVKPKEPKSTLPPIPKPKAKIRVAPKKNKQSNLPEPESEEDEPDEIPYKNFKLVDGVPKNIKKIFYEYVDDRTGYANKENQEEEIEELQRIEKNYIEAEANRKNKSLSASKQMKSVKTIGSILIETRNDINNNPDLKKIYKVFTPTILKRVLDQKKKDEADLKKEAEQIKKQEKADEKEFKKSLKEDKKTKKSK